MADRVHDGPKTSGRVLVLFTDDQRARVAAAAGRKGVGISTYVRMITLERLDVEEAADKV